MGSKQVVRLLNAADDIMSLGAGAEKVETLILRGVIDPETLANIRVDSYQREVLSKHKIAALAAAIKTSCVPDVELGMRGEKYQVAQVDGKDVYILADEVYVIDGLQRITAARHLQQVEPDLAPRIGALVHFLTDFNWERARFKILNQDRTKLSVNILLRNSVHDHPSVDMIHKLCDDEAFALHRRVQWSQSMLREQITSALTLCKVAGVLHSRFGPGRSHHICDLADGLDKIMGTVGRTTMRDNLLYFFELVDQCWGVRTIVYADGAAHIRSTFLTVLADVLTCHDVFWRGHKLFIEKDLLRKISQFSVTDPEIARLAVSGGQAGSILYELMVRHINSGKRTKRISPTT